MRLVAHAITNLHMNALHEIGSDSEKPFGVQTAPLFRSYQNML